MSAITPANVSRAIGFGRIAFGAALLVVPAQIGKSWLGEAGTTPAAQVALRGLGIRDAVIGMAQVHTANDPERGYRWARTSAFGDITDLVSTVVASKSLPRSGVIGTGALAGFAAVSSLLVSRSMQASS